MAISLGRKMTKKDWKRLTAAAQRFCKKWGIDGGDIPVDYAAGAADFATNAEQARDMKRDWAARVKRALGGYTTWGHGYVGYRAD